MARQTAAAKVDRAEKTAILVRSLAAGRTLSTVANELGLSHGTAHNWYTEALRETWEESAGDREAVLGAELTKLAIAERALMPKVLIGDPRSIDVYLRVMDRRARYLGLDQPAKVRVEVGRVDEVVAEIVQIIDGEGAAQPAPLLRLEPKAG